MLNTMMRPLQDTRMTRPHSARHPYHAMRCDIKEYEDRYELDLELPGFRKEDIRISVQDSSLTVHAEHPAQENESGNLIRSERYTGPYVRTFRIGRDIDCDNAGAAYENGILKIRLNKVHEEPGKNTIEIQ